MAASQPLTGVELVNCAQANAKQGIAAPENRRSTGCSRCYQQRTPC